MSKSFLSLKYLSGFLIFGVLVSLPESVWAACGEILVSKGDIKVESASGGKPTAAAQGTKVCQGDTIIAGLQSRAKVKMEDGNELNISPESRIKLEIYEYKPADNKKKVMLNVLYGKVRSATREENMYNDQAKDGQANTFQVKTKSAVAGVRGTDFLTSFDRKTSKTEVVTFKGSVDVGRAGPGGTIMNAVSIGAGQKTEALPGAPPAPPKPVPSKDMEKMNVESSAEIADVKRDAPPARESSSTSSEPKRDEGKKDASTNSSGGGSGAANGSGSSSSSGANAGGASGSASGNASGGASGGASTSGGATAGGPNSSAGGGSAAATRPKSETSPPRPGGSMITSGDLGKAPDRSPANIGGGPTLVMPPAPIPTPPPIPASELVRQQLETGPGKVNIRIIVPQ